MFCVKFENIKFVICKGYALAVMLVSNDSLNSNIRFSAQLYIVSCHCREHELRARGVNGSLRGAALPNESFWSEWACLKVSISEDLRDLLNRIFVLEAGLRITLRDILRHSWVTVDDGISPDIIRFDMENR